MVIENLLLAIEAGLGHGETAIFPIAIFKVKEGVNYYPEDPNYDLFKLACRVSAKRLFPNFAFLDAPFNKQYYKEGVPESEVTYMGCVQGCEMITYKINDKIITSSFEKLWNEMSYLECKTYGISEYFETSGIVKIYDTLSERFVDCKKVIKNPNRNNWMHITLSNGQSINCTLDHPFPVLNKDTGELLRTFTSDIKIGDEIPSTDKGVYYSVVDIRPIDIDEDSYDVETESDRFDVSGIISHNCRSRVMGNVHDPSREQSHSRGNLSFTSINLPMIALESEGDEKKFYQNLHKALDVVKAQLLERFEIQAKRKVYNFPFLMGQGIWLDSEKLKWDDEVREVIKHGSLAIGFVGLAEALVALYGHHHGEGEEYWKKGYNIIKYMREYTDKAAEETKLNFAVIGTPAESYAGRALRKTRDKFGVIEGVTDRDYFTNSNHIPVYYPISAYDKIRLEAPFHELTNGGHITYVELDGDTTKNIDVFEKIIRCMHDAGIGYGSINHPVDRDPVCGYTGVINDECPNCKRKETEDSKFERIRRITGYLVGTLTRWNSAKKAEEEDRVKHEV